MDREVKELYQVLIQAKDMGGQLGGLAGTATINITLSDVNDNPPRFSKSKALHYYILQLNSSYSHNVQRCIIYFNKQIFAKYIKCLQYIKQSNTETENMIHLHCALICK